MSNQDDQLHSVLQTLEECQAVLTENRSRETADLLSIAILDLRMKLNRVGSSELKALCDQILREIPPKPLQRNVEQRQPRRPPLRLVK